LPIFNYVYDLPHFAFAASKVTSKLPQDVSSQLLQ
jgi:hypothetical protein